MRMHHLPEGTRECCRETTARVTVSLMEVGRGDTGPSISEHQRCVVCGNNHYIVHVPPVPLGVSGGGLG